MDFVVTIVVYILNFKSPYYFWFFIQIEQNELVWKL